MDRVPIIAPCFCQDHPSQLVLITFTILDSDRLGAVFKSKSAFQRERVTAPRNTENEDAVVSTESFTWFQIHFKQWLHRWNNASKVIILKAISTSDI